MNNQDQLTEKIKEIAEDLYVRTAMDSQDKNYLIGVLTAALKDKSLLLMALKELEGEEEVEAIQEHSFYDLARQINGFLKDQNIKVISLQYQTISQDPDSYTFNYTCLIHYYRLKPTTHE